MKYLIIVPDGISDCCVADRETVTPMQKADTPCIDGLSSSGIQGLAKICGGSVKPEQSLTLLSLFGADPVKIKYSAPAVRFTGEGNTLDKDDVCLCCAFVTEYESEKQRYLKLLGDDITPEESEELFSCLRSELENDVFRFYKGKEKYDYIVWKKGEPKAGTLYSPDEFERLTLDELLPKGDFIFPLQRLMQKSVDIFAEHPINKERVERGKPAIAGIWIWDESVLPDVISFRQMFGIEPVIITDSYSAAGAARCLSVPVELIRGGLSEMAEAASEVLEKNDAAVVVTDRAALCSLSGDEQKKISCIEEIDRELIGSILKKTFEELSVLIVPSFTVSVKKQEATADFVPYMIYIDGAHCNSGSKTGFSEKTAFAAGDYMSGGRELMEKFFHPSCL